MNEVLTNLVARVKNYYQGLESRQRRNLFLIVIFFFLTIIILSFIFLNPNYQVVFSNLGAKSAGEITQKLDQMKIPYQLQGNSILVPAADADKVRIDMAMNGLPASGTIQYSSIFNQGNLFGMTSQELNLQTLDVLEQRIAQSIDSINGVQNAQVNIVVPQQQTFLDPSVDTGAKASVVITVGAGAALAPNQVFGIQQLVAHAVQGLNANQVSVIDQYGNDLSNGSVNSSGMTASSQLTTELNMRNALDQSMAGQLKTSLMKLVGPGNVEVVVHANVTFNQVTQHQHIVKQGPTLSVQAQSSSSTGGGTTIGGVAGQATQNPNLPTYGTQGAGTGSSSANRSSTTNYDNSYTNTATTYDPMQLQGYTVSVLINANAIKLTKPLTQSIQSYVLTSMGQQATGKISPSVTVLGIPFAVGQGSTPVAPSFYNSPLAVGGLAALLLIGGGIATVMIVRSRNRKRLTDDAIDSLSVATLSSPPQEPEDVTLSKQLQELAVKKPDAFASLLRTWLSEE